MRTFRQYRLILSVVMVTALYAACISPYMLDFSTTQAPRGLESGPVIVPHAVMSLPSKVRYELDDTIDPDRDLTIRNQMENGSWKTLSYEREEYTLSARKNEAWAEAFDPVSIAFRTKGGGGEYTVTVTAPGYDDPATGADFTVAFMVYVDRLPQANPDNKAFIVMPKQGKIVYDKDDFLNPADDLDVYWRDVYGITTKLNYDATNSSSPFSVSLSAGTVSWDSVAGRVIQLTQAGNITVTVRADSAHDSETADYNIVVNPAGELSLFVGSAKTVYLPGEAFVPAAVYWIDNAGSTARVPDNELVWKIQAPGEDTFTTLSWEPYTFTAGGGYTVSVTASGLSAEPTTYAVVVRTDADAEDFGVEPFPVYTVYSVDHCGTGTDDENSWQWAVAQINAAANGTAEEKKNFIINLTGDVDFSYAGYPPYFTGNYVRVSLRGDHEIKLGETAYGSILSIETNQTVILRGPTLTGKDVNTSAVVNVFAGGAFVMRSGAVKDNESSFEGGGVWVSNEGTFTMYGGTISGNSARYGGGVWVYSMLGTSATFTMYGGTISGNSATDGGGVYVSGVFTMNGGTISGNNIADAMGNVEGFGSGVKVSNGEFRMLGGTISGNTNGGGVVFDSWGGMTFRMLGGSIRGNGVYGVYGANHIELYAGEIKDNYTGGIYQQNTGSFSIFNYGGSPYGAVQSGGIVIQGNGIQNNYILSNVRLEGNYIEYNGISVNPSVGLTGIGMTNVKTGTVGEVTGIPPNNNGKGWVYSAQ